MDNSFVAPEPEIVAAVVVSSKYRSWLSPIAAPYMLSTVVRTVPAHPDCRNAGYSAEDGS